MDSSTKHGLKVSKILGVLISFFFLSTSPGGYFLVSNLSCFRPDLTFIYISMRLTCFLQMNLPVLFVFDLGFEVSRSHVVGES